MTTTTLTSFLRALRYESVRMRTAVSVRVFSALALFGVALATLPAVRDLSDNLGGLGKAGSADVAWLVDGGRLGNVLPGCAAAAAAAWIGACSIDYEYRHGTAVSLFASIPRRGAVLAAKIVLVAVFGAVLELACAALAFGTASLGFVMAGFPHPLPLPAALAPPLGIAFAAGCGVLSLLLATIVRLRLLATSVALALVTIAAACVARADSLNTVSPTDTPTPGRVDPLATPVGRVVDQFSALAHLPDSWKSAPFLGLALVGAVAVLLAAAARGSIGRRRAQ